MKLGITKKELPILAERYLRYIGGMIAGAGIGMMLAVGFVPEDDRKLFRMRYYVIAFAFLCVGAVIGGIVADFIRRKTAVKE